MTNKFLRFNPLGYVLMLLVVLTSSCGGSDDDANGGDGGGNTTPPPTAEFSTDANLLEITTTNTSTNATSYAWDFGADGAPGNTSTLFEPVFTYPQAGTYTITLTVAGAGGDDTFMADVTVAGPDPVPDPPVAGFSVSSMDLTVTTTNTSINATSYAWNFGSDGTTGNISTEQTPMFTYPAAGTYAITLVATGPGGDDTTSSNVVVSEGTTMVVPSPSFTSDPNFLEVVFTNTSTDAVSYSWDFGDGNSSTDENPTHTYGAAGTYQVILTATSSTDDSAMTMATDVTVAAAVAPVADFTSVPTDLAVQFTDASMANDGNITAYAWDFGDTAGTSTEASPMYTYTTAGTYDVILTITFDDINGSTTATVTKPVTVTEPAGAAPVAGITLPTSIIQGEAVTFTDATVVNDGANLMYSWDFGDGATSTDMSPMHTYTTSGPQTVTLTVTYDPIPGVTETTTVATESITVAAPGTPPVAGITLPTDPIVAGQAATFTDATVVNDGTGLTYSWNFGDMTPPSTMPSPMHTYAMEGMYTVTLTVTYDPIPGVTETTTVAMEMVTVTAPAPPMELVQNGTADDFNVTTAPSNTGDNADAFDMTPNSTVVDNSGMTIDSPYRRTAANPNGWRNDALEDWLELNCQNPPGAVNEQPSSTSDGAGDTRGLKLTDCRRIYQLVQVTSGTNYTFSIDTRSEAMNTPMTIYVLNTEIADETADLIPANILGSQVITTDFNTNKDIFTTTTFNFTASSTQIVIYGVPTGTGGAEEVFIDNVSIIAN